MSESRLLQRNKVGTLTDEQLWCLDQCIADGDFGEFEEIGRSDFFYCAEQMFDDPATEADYQRWLNDIGA
jgi:hypothetical protein